MPTPTPRIPIWILDRQEQSEDMDRPRDLESPTELDQDEPDNPYESGNPDPTRPYRLRTQDHEKDIQP